MKNKIFLHCIASMALASYHPTHATDHRVTALVTLSAATAIGGLYLLLKKPNDSAHSITKTVTGLSLIGIGSFGILASHEILEAFDKLLRRLRWEQGDFRWRDFIP